MLKFCFPERDPEGIEEAPAPQRDSSFYVPIERRDDVEKMKERADKNKLFIYIKIPEVPVRVSYKVRIYKLKKKKIFLLLPFANYFLNFNFTFAGKQGKESRGCTRLCASHTDLGVS